jgi:hypothetical protein
MLLLVIKNWLRNGTSDTGPNWEKNRNRPGSDLQPVLRIRIRRILMFLGLLDLDQLVRGTDPDPSIIKQK